MFSLLCVSSGAVRTYDLIEKGLRPVWAWGKAFLTVRTYDLIEKGLRRLYRLHRHRRDAFEPMT